MKKIVFLLLSFSILTFAGKINWVSYKTYLNMAKSKPGFIFVSASSCYFCKVEMKRMNANKSFVKFVNKRFIPVFIEEDKEFTPVNLISRMTPTFYLLNSSGNYLISPIIGAQPLDYMLRVMNRAEYLFRSKQ